MIEVINEVLRELERATAKFPTWPTDPLHALAILGEEYGELNKEMLQLVYEPHKTNPGLVRSEAIQTAAMALRLAMSLDAYKYTPSQQHQQEALPPKISDGVVESIEKDAVPNELKPSDVLEYVKGDLLPAIGSNYLY